MVKNGELAKLQTDVEWIKTGIRNINSKLDEVCDRTIQNETRINDHEKEQIRGLTTMGLIAGIIATIVSFIMGTFGD